METLTGGRASPAQGREVAEDRESCCINELQQTADQASAGTHPLISIGRGATSGNALVFVDADNQTPALAKPLLRFLASIGHRAGRVFVAGNGSGDRVTSWETALSEIHPDVQIFAHVAPMRKQSADVRLMFELATLYHGRPNPQAVILIVSRDDLLLAAAEALNAQGHHVLITVGASAPAVPLATELPVVVLPVPQTAAQPASRETTERGEVKQNLPPGGGDAQIVSAAVTKIRQALSQSKGGGYAASDVGQVLAQMGHDKATRARIVKAIPNLKETGAGADKRLVF